MSYGINDIETLSFKDGVRQRIAMYLGSADMNGVYNAIQEIISNSIDEFYMGYGKQIEISLFENNRISFRDYGRGVPFGIKEDGSNTLVDIFSKPHTGGKFNDKVYQSVAGLNGIGAKATCLSSLNFTVFSYRNNLGAHALFEKGSLVDYRELSTNEKDGTFIEFTPDSEVYNLVPIEIDFEFLCEKCKNLSYLTKGLKFILKDCTKATTKEVIYCAEHGLLDLLEDTVSNPVHKTPMYYEYTDGDIHLEVALQWTKEKEKNFVFTNGLHNSEGGTSLTGLKTSITRTINRAFRKDFSGEMARSGLVYAISAKLPNPSFANQTKTKINNPELRGAADKAFAEAFNIFKGKYPKELEEIKEFLSKEEKAEKAAQRARDAIINQTKAIQAAGKKKVILADKLKDCEKHGEDSMLVLTEGDSALGAMAQARPTDHVALYPLRGKIINALKNDLEKVLSNQEVKDIISLLGCGILENYNPKRLRYGKIGIATDGDADGYNIMCLIATLFYVLMPEFLEEGRLYWLRAPLYRVECKGKVYFCYSDEELAEKIKSLKGAKHEVGYVKGLGELQSEDTEQAFFGSDEKLERFIIDADDTYAQIEMLMGTEVGPRREFVFNNIDFSKIGD